MHSIPGPRDTLLPSYEHGRGPYLIYTRARPSAPWQFRGRGATAAAAQAAAAGLLVALGDSRAEAQVRRLGDGGPPLSTLPESAPPPTAPGEAPRE